MPERSERWLRWIWLVNGIVLLPLLLVAGVTLAWTTGSGWWGSPDGVTAGDPEGAERPEIQPRAVRLSGMELVAGSDARLIAVRHGRGNYPARSYGLSGSSYALEGGYYGDGPVVNMIILSSAREGHLLFDRPALVASWDRPRPDEEEDVGQEWMAFHAVLEDTNRNGRLDGDDRHDLYLTDLDGSRLRRALGDSFSVQSHRRLTDPERLLVYALRIDSDLAAEDQPLHAFLINPATAAAEPYDAVNALVEQAGRIVGR